MAELAGDFAAAAVLHIMQVARRDYADATYYRERGCGYSLQVSGLRRALDSLRDVALYFRELTSLYPDIESVRMADRELVQAVQTVTRWLEILR